MVALSHTMHKTDNCFILFLSLSLYHPYTCSFIHVLHLLMLQSVYFVFLTMCSENMEGEEDYSVYCDRSNVEHNGLQLLFYTLTRESEKYN